MKNMTSFVDLLLILVLVSQYGTEAKAFGKGQRQDPDVQPVAVLLSSEGACIGRRAATAWECASPPVRVNLLPSTDLKGAAVTAVVRPYGQVVEDLEALQDLLVQNESTGFSVVRRH